MFNHDIDRSKKVVLQLPGSVSTDSCDGKCGGGGGGNSARLMHRDVRNDGCS